MRDGAIIIVGLIVLCLIGWAVYNTSTEMSGPIPTPIPGSIAILSDGNGVMLTDKSVVVLRAGSIVRLKEGAAQSHEDVAIIAFLPPSTSSAFPAPPKEAKTSQCEFCHKKEFIEKKGVENG